VFRKLVSGLLGLALLITSTTAYAVPPEPAYADHKVQEIWAKGFKGEGVTVAVIDQGINLAHEYFTGQVVDGICVYQTQSQSLCPNGTKYQTGIQAASQRFDKGAIVSNESHGNMVSGLIAGKPNEQAPGGIAPNAKLLMANTDLALPSLVSALTYIYDNREKYNIVAVSMSFGTGGGSTREYMLDCNLNPDYAQLKATLSKLRSVGIMPFAASGNGFILNEITWNAPTCLSEAVTIGAIDQRGKVSMYSTMNSKVELLGTDYAKSAYTEGYKPAGGTSAATPVVAAGYALLRQAFPSASPQLVLDAMKQSGRLIDDVVRKQIPVLDLLAAYNILSTTPSNPTPSTSSSPVAPTPSPTPTPPVSSSSKSSIVFTTTPGNLVITINGFAGKEFKAKIGNTWIKIPKIVESGRGFIQIVRKAVSKTTVKYIAYIDGKKITSGSVLIR
jgi:subtilisin family serine protease